MFSKYVSIKGGKGVSGCRNVPSAGPRESPTQNCCFVLRRCLSTQRVAKARSSDRHDQVMTCLCLASIYDITIGERDRFERVEVEKKEQPFSQSFIWSAVLVLIGLSAKKQAMMHREIASIGRCAAHSASEDCARVFSGIEYSKKVAICTWTQRRLGPMRGRAYEYMHRSYREHSAGRVYNVNSIFSDLNSEADAPCSPDCPPRLKRDISTTEQHSLPRRARSSPEDIGQEVPTAHKEVH